MRESPIPVMYFSNTRARGGAEEHILTLVRGLDREAFRLHLVCSPEVADALRGDPKALSEAICTMLRSPALRQRLAEQGRAHVLERFSQERQVRETAEFYHEALG